MKTLFVSHKKETILVFVCTSLVLIIGMVIFFTSRQEDGEGNNTENNQAQQGSLPLSDPEEERRQENLQMYTNNSLPSFSVTYDASLWELNSSHYNKGSRELISGYLAFKHTISDATLYLHGGSFFAGGFTGTNCYRGESEKINNDIYRVSLQELVSGVGTVQNAFTHYIEKEDGIQTMNIPYDYVFTSLYDETVEDYYETFDPDPTQADFCIQTEFIVDTNITTDNPEFAEQNPATGYFSLYLDVVDENNLEEVFEDVSELISGIEGLQ